MSAAVRWISIIVGLLVGNVIAVVVLIGASGGDTGRRVLPDYYARAADWDTTMAAAKASAGLGWASTLDVRGRQLELTLRDAAGAPLDGAVVTVQGGPRGRADEHEEVTLIAAGAGRYRGSWPGRRAGLHQLALSATRGADRWIVERTVELGAP